MMASSLMAAFRGQAPAAEAATQAEHAPAAGAETPALGFGALLKAFLGAGAAALRGSDESATQASDETPVTAVEPEGGPVGEGQSAGGVPSAVSAEAGGKVGKAGAERTPVRDGTTTPVGWISMTKPSSSSSAAATSDQDVDEADEVPSHVEIEIDDGLDTARKTTPPAAVPHAAQAAEVAPAVAVPAPQPVDPGVVDPPTSEKDGVERAGPVDGARRRGDADVRTADRSLAHLAPGLRTRVERVMRRMAEERGENVVLVEGYRTPERQGYLYAQGRTRPGPVVTWTTDSRHSRGEAADLKVEGSWNQRSSYAALQRIAREEGLATLGMKDPGHVELPAGAAREAEAPGTAPAPMDPEATDPALPVERHGLRVAAVARTARAAGPATVAAVARPAPVARPGAPARATDHREPPPAAVDTSAALHATPREAGATPQQAGNGQGPRVARSDGGAPSVDAPGTMQGAAPSPRTTDPSSRPTPGAKQGTAAVEPPAGTQGPGKARPSGRGRGDRARRDGDGPVEIRADGRSTSQEARGGGTPGGGHGGDVRAAAPTPQAAMATPADALNRVEQALELRDALGATASNRVSVRLDGTAGPVQRVQVDLADTALRSVVDVDDARLATHLRDGREELVRALTEKGFDPQELAVRLANTRPDATRASQEAGWNGLRMDGAAGALRAMLSGDGAGTQHRSSQGQHRNPDGWYEGRQQNGSNNRSREEQRRERR